MGRAEIKDTAWVCIREEGVVMGMEKNWHDGYVLFKGCVTGCSFEKPCV